MSSPESASQVQHHHAQVQSDNASLARVRLHNRLVPRRRNLPSIGPRRQLPPCLVETARYENDRMQHQPTHSISAIGCKSKHPIEGLITLAHNKILASDQ